ncbi:hypothetical protein ES708_30637 [subsurface metagenome]
MVQGQGEQHYDVFIRLLKAFARYGRFLDQRLVGHSHPAGMEGRPRGIGDVGDIFGRRLGNNRRRRTLGDNLIVGEKIPLIFITEVDNPLHGLELV